MLWIKTKVGAAALLMGAAGIAAGLFISNSVGMTVSGAAGTDSSASSTVTKGTIPDSAFTSSGLDMSQVPDYVSVIDRQGQIVGYISKTDMVPAHLAPSDPSATQPSPADEAAQNAQMVQVVYGSDLKTVVGHMYPAKGFVPLGTDPNSVQSIPVSSTSK